MMEKVIPQTAGLRLSEQSSSFDFRPTLAAELITLRPLTADDLEAVYAAAADPVLWGQHPGLSCYQRDIFTNRFFAGAAVSQSAFVIIDNASGLVV